MFISLLTHFCILLLKPSEQSLDLYKAEQSAIGYLENHGSGSNIKIGERQSVCMGFGRGREFLSCLLGFFYIVYFSVHVRVNVGTT